MVEVVKRALGPEESRTFEEEFRKLAIFFPQRRWLEILEDHKEEVREAVEIAKEKFDMPFAGMLAKGNTFGWRFITPQDVGQSTGWANDVTATGWQDWIGTATSPQAISENALLIVLGFYNLASTPLSVSAKIAVNQTTYPVVYMEPALKMGDIHVFELGKPLIIQPESNLHIRVNYATTGTDNLALLGLTIAKASYLSSESYG